MGKVSKKNSINEGTKRLATMLVDGILNKDRKSADKALSEMVNNRISAKIKKVAQTEDLI